MGGLHCTRRFPGDAPNKAVREEADLAVKAVFSSNSSLEYIDVLIMRWFAFLLVWVSFKSAFVFNIYFFLGGDFFGFGGSFWGDLSSDFDLPCFSTSFCLSKRPSFCFPRLPRSRGLPALPAKAL